METNTPVKSVSKYSRMIMQEFEAALTSRLLKTTSDPVEIQKIEERYNRAKARIFRQMAE